MIVQFLLVGASLILLFYFLSSISTIKIRAYKKILLFILAIAMVVFVLFPELLNELANKVGVGRGADLLLYTLFVAFIFVVLNVYIKFKQQQDTIFRIARKLAIIEALDNVQNKKK